MPLFLTLVIGARRERVATLLLPSWLKANAWRRKNLNWLHFLPGDCLFCLSMRPPAWTHSSFLSLICNAVFWQRKAHSKISGCLFFSNSPKIIHKVTARRRKPTLTGKPVTWGWGAWWHVERQCPRYQPLVHRTALDAAQRVHVSDTYFAFCFHGLFQEESTELKIYFLGVQI